eukprot:403349435
MERKGGMSPLKFRKMIQIMKSSEVNIDVNQLQKLFKQKQKRENTEEEHEQRTGFLPYLTQTSKQKMQIHQEIEQEERDEEKQMLSHTFQSIQKLKSPSMFSKFDNTKTSLEVKKELEKEIKRKIGQKVLKLMTMRIQANKTQNKNLSDSLMTEIQESVADQNLQEQINSPNVDILEKQSQTSSIIIIEPFNDVNLNLDIVKIKSENNYGRNGIEDNELLQHNLDESIIDFQNENFVQTDSPNFLVLEKTKTSLLTESRQKVNRFKPKKTVRFNSQSRQSQQNLAAGQFEEILLKEDLKKVLQQKQSRFQFVSINPMKHQNQEDLSKIEKSSFFITETSISRLQNKINESAHRINLESVKSKNDDFFEAFFTQLQSDKQTLKKQPFQFQLKSTP